MIEVIKKLRFLLSRRDKKWLVLLLTGSIFVSFLETLSVSLIMVFASVATNFKLIESNTYYSFLYDFLGSNSYINFVISLGFILIGFYFFRAFVISSFNYAMNRFSQGRYKYFAYKFFKHYLNFKYKDFTNTDSAKIRNVLASDVSKITSILSSFLILVSELLTLGFIYAGLLFLHFKMTLVLTFLLGIKLFFIIKTFSKKITQVGKLGHEFTLKLSKAFWESLGNYKLIRILGAEKSLLERFDKATNGIVHSNIFSSTLNVIPRLILETLGFSALISVIIYVLYMYKDASHVIPIVSMYAFAFYRFLPSINKILSAMNQIKFCKPGLDSINYFLNYELEEVGSKRISFKKNLVLKNASFSYDGKNKILNNLNLSIKKGERIAFIGDSGEGKSTLVDVLMGIYKLDSGAFFVDSKQITSQNVKSWRKFIGYIPQDIYLFDGTVAENILLGREYNKNKTLNSVEKANIYDFLQTKNGINTRVGEGGILLSGGQKQRIAIARALYSDPEVLVLDEATSALDNQTEEKIMEEVYSLNKEKTLIVIAHRLSTVSRCDKIYKIDNGNVYLVDDIANIYVQQKVAQEVVV